RQAAQRPEPQEGHQPQAGDRDRAVAGPQGRREGPGEEALADGVKPEAGGRPQAVVRAALLVAAARVDPAPPRLRARAPCGGGGGGGGGEAAPGRAAAAGRRSWIVTAGCWVSGSAGVCRCPPLAVTAMLAAPAAPDLRTTLVTPSGIPSRLL